MKKKILTLLITVLFTVIVYSQNYWTSEIDINFLVQSNTKVASFVDVNGVHIVYSRNGGIRYALVNSNGGIIKYDKVIESEGAGTNFANVVVFGNNVYAVYYKNNDIKVAKSTNLGDTWNNAFSSRDLINAGCNKILAYQDGSSIHIVWSEVRVSGWGYDSHYIRFAPSGLPTYWNDYKNVTDNETYGGDEPDVTFSLNRVHVSFIKYQFDEPKTRDRYAGTWQTSQSVPFEYLPFTTSLRKGKPIVANGWLNEIYRADFASIGTEGSYIGHSYRSLSNSTWYQNDENLFTPVDKIHVVNNTTNNRIHIIYYSELAGNYVHNYLSGTTYSDIIATVPLFEQSSFLSGNSNDLYLLRINNPDTPSKIKFRHYDDAQVAPQNLAITKSANNHPLLSWSPNTEPDRSYYKIYRWDSYGGGWQYLAQSSNTSYEDGTLIYCTTIPPQQCPDLRTFKFKVTAIDLGSHESEPSNIVESSLVGGPPTKAGANNPDDKTVFEYALGQNYPNPFNPSTTISYSIKTPGEVALKVYDMLGTEVSSLVNEMKEAGNYSVTFSASDLPSGIYFYTLTSGNFISTKKLILLK